MEEVMKQILPAIYTALAALISWAIMQGTKWLKAKTQSEILKSAADSIQTAAINAVKETEMAMADKLRDAKGKLTAEAAEQMKAVAMVSALNQIGPATVEKFQRASKIDTDGMKKILSSQIESAVHDLKFFKKK